MNIVSTTFTCISVSPFGQPGVAVFACADGSEMTIRFPPGSPLPTVGKMYMVSVMEV